MSAEKGNARRGVARRALENGSVRSEQKKNRAIDSDDQAEIRGFTSWKLEVMNALSADPSVTDLDFRVAFRILQHVNSVSRIAWPSVARLAAQLDKSEDRIRASTKRLQAGGWMIKERRSQRSANEYRFLDKRIADVLDAMQARVEMLESSSDDHAEMHGQKADDHADLRADHADLPCCDHADLHGKHLHFNHLHETPSVPGSEFGEGTYTHARENIPSDEREYGLWIERNIQDLGQRRAALRLLAEGKMTAEILKRLAA